MEKEARLVRSHSIPWENDATAISGESGEIRLEGAVRNVKNVTFTRASA